MTTNTLKHSDPRWWKKNVLRIFKLNLNSALITQMIVILSKALPHNHDHSSEFEGIPMCWNQAPPDERVVPCQTTM